MKPDTLVTGSSGFIGQCLCKQLGDCHSIAHCEIAGEPLKPHRRVFFLSTYGNLYGQQDALAILQANCFDPITLAIRLGWESQAFVFVSTSSVDLPVQTVYSRCKRLTEVWLTCSKTDAFCPKIVRPFSVTGVGEQRQHLIPTLIRSCLENEPMFFDPVSEHDYIDVTDVVAGLLTAAEDPRLGPFELGWGRSVTNDEVRELVEQETQQKAKIIRHEKLRPYDGSRWKCRGPSAWPADWKPMKPLKDSIAQMVEAYEQSRKTLR